MYHKLILIDVNPVVLPARLMILQHNRVSCYCFKVSCAPPTPPGGSMNTAASANEGFYENIMRGRE